MELYARFVEKLNAGDTPEIRERITSNVNLLHALIGINTENGELQDQIKRHFFYGAPLDKVNLVEELGDLFWYIQLALNTMDVSLDEMIQRNMNKLRKRYPDKFDAARAITRDLPAERIELEKQ